jgi:rod shape determining protein RodA
MKFDKRKLYHLDWYFIANGLAIFVIGIFNLVSATSSFSSGSYNFLLKQLIAFFIGLVLIVIIINIDYRTITSYAKWIYGTGLFLVVLVLIMGMIAGGAKRWFNLSG